jgi:oligo-1,6-glucosidase
VPEKANVQKWVAGNYTAGAPDKPVTGSIKLRAWEGVLGMSALSQGEAEH